MGGVLGAKSQILGVTFFQNYMYVHFATGGQLSVLDTTLVFWSSCFTDSHLLKNNNHFFVTVRSRRLSCSYVT